MEPVVFGDTPLAEYLRDGGDESDTEWTAAIPTPEIDSSGSEASPPASPSPFAPTGRPMVKARFRNHVPNALRIDTSQPSSLRAIKRHYSAAIAANIDRADKAKFLEQFRYTIVASQLLSGHPVPGQHYPASSHAPGAATNATTNNDTSLLSFEGFLGSVLGALAVAAVLSWVLGGASSSATWRRIAILAVLFAASTLVGGVYMRRQSLRKRRQQALSQVTEFVANSHDFDSATGAALSLVQEVELVSRGYRITAPLPPISRIEDRSQSRKCVRLRKVLKDSFAGILKAQSQVLVVVKGFCEQTELEKYYDIYDISELDMSDALREFDATEFEDPESLKSLKILAARFNIVRKMFLCALLALDTNEESTDLLRWTTAVESLRNMNVATKDAFNKLQRTLSEEESFPTPPTPKGPLTPGRERWRSQMRKLNSMSSGIRGLQAKLQLLREESDRALNDAHDISELGPDLMSQYESIGADLKELMSVWEDGKSTLALGIDRNEKRLSSMSTLISPSSSLSGQTMAEEGSAADALKALNGDLLGSSHLDEPTYPDTPEVFEAVSLPRPRSTLTREERIVKMREDRDQKAQARQHMDATRGMLRELETVINLRPKTRTSAPPSRIVSM